MVCAHVEESYVNGLLRSFRQSNRAKVPPTTAANTWWLETSKRILENCVLKQNKGSEIMFCKNEIVKITFISKENFQFATLGERLVHTLMQEPQKKQPAAKVSVKCAWESARKIFFSVAFVLLFCTSSHSSKRSIVTDLLHRTSHMCCQLKKVTLVVQRIPAHQYLVSIHPKGQGARRHNWSIGWSLEMWDSSNVLLKALLQKEMPAPPNIEQKYSAFVFADEFAPKQCSN